MVTCGMKSGIFQNRLGFTLIELMIVLTVIGILTAIAVPNYQRSVIRAREAVLSDTLHIFRKAIDEYYADRGRYPDSLTDLVGSGYMRSVPADPFTRASDTWVTVAPPPLAAATEPGTAGEPVAEAGNVYDVHSGSDLLGGNGVPYNEW
jgi:general secretion pathway protein G